MFSLVPGAIYELPFAEEYRSHVEVKKKKKLRLRHFWRRAKKKTPVLRTPLASVPEEKSGVEIMNDGGSVGDLELQLISGNNADDDMVGQQINYQACLVLLDSAMDEVENFLRMKVRPCISLYDTRLLPHHLLTRSLLLSIIRCCLHSSRMRPSP